MFSRLFSAMLLSAAVGAVTTKALWVAFIVILFLLAAAIIVFLLHSRRRLQREEDERERLAEALSQAKKRQKAAENRLFEAGEAQKRAQLERDELLERLELQKEPLIIDEPDTEAAPAAPTEEEKKRAFLATTAVLVGSDYELVSIIDLANDSFEVLGAERSGELLSGEISYSEASRSFASDSCVPADRERVLWLTSIPGLREQLSDREFFELTADVSEDGVTKRKIMRFTRFDEEGSLLLATRRDVTDMIERESRGQSALAAALLVRESESAEKSELVSSVSRSVSGKLNDVVILSASAAEESADESAKAAFRSIRESSSAVSGLLADILDILQLEDGKRSPGSDTVYMPDFIAGIRDIGQAEGKARSCRCTQKSGGAVPKLLIFDKGRTERLLASALRSAVLRAPEGGEISCTLTCSAPANGRVYLRFAIADSGEGMDRDAAQSAFELCDREDGSGGMELYITKHLAEALDGSAELDTAPGSGTTLTITLPAKPAD